MTKTDILHALAEIAAYKGVGRSPFIMADLVHQEDLFALQEQLGKLMVRLLNDSDVPDPERYKVVRKLPNYFVRV